VIGDLQYRTNTTAAPIKGGDITFLVLQFIHTIYDRKRAVIDRAYKVDTGWRWSKARLWTGIRERSGSDTLRRVLFF